VQLLWKRPICTSNHDEPILDINFDQVLDKITQDVQRRQDEHDRIHRNRLYNTGEKQELLEATPDRSCGRCFPTREQFTPDTQEFLELWGVELVSYTGQTQHKCRAFQYATTA